MLVTQNNNFTSWNSSFSSKEQGNSNEVFNLEFPSKIEVSSDTKTAKTLEINGIEYPEFPSSNMEINSAVSSAVSSATAVSQTTTTTATAYGYSVDSKGFMGADFNKAVGISENVKIHSKTIEQLTTHAKNIGFNGSAVEITKKAWSNFSQIIGDESALKGEKSLAQTNIPLSFTTDGSILGQVTSVQSDINSFVKAVDYESSLYALNATMREQSSEGSFSGLTIPFIFDAYNDDEMFSHFYKQSVGIEKAAEFGIGEMFAVFINQTYEINGIENAKIGQEFKNSGKSLKDFIISKEAMDKLQEMVAQMHTEQSRFSKDELLNQVLMGMI